MSSLPVRIPFGSVRDRAVDGFEYRLAWLPALIAAAVLGAGLFAAAPDSDGPARISVRAADERTHPLPVHAGAPTLININTASPEELQTLAGIGEKTAAQIIAARPFSCLEDLLRIGRFDAALFASIELKITTGRDCS